MSQEYEGQNPIDIAKRAEQNVNSYDAKVGRPAGESGMCPSSLSFARRSLLWHNGSAFKVTRTIGSLPPLPTPSKTSHHASDN